MQNISLKVHFFFIFLSVQKLLLERKVPFLPPPIPWSKLMAVCEGRRRRFHSSTGRNGFPNQLYTKSVCFVPLQFYVSTCILFKCTYRIYEQCFILIFLPPGVLKAKTSFLLRSFECSPLSPSGKPPPPPIAKRKRRERIDRGRRKGETDRVVKGDTNYPPILEKTCAENLYIKWEIGLICFGIY